MSTLEIFFLTSALLGAAVNLTLLILFVVWAFRVLAAMEGIARSVGAGQQHLDQIRQTSGSIARSLTGS